MNNDLNQRVIVEFRTTQGTFDSPTGQAILAQLLQGVQIEPLSYIPMLLLTTTGAKSGKEHIVPVAYLPVDHRFLIIASNRGAPSSPDWYYNLLAHPIVTVEIESERFQARAETIASGAERDRLFALMVEQLPPFAEYERKTTRTIPVVLLERIRVDGL